MIITAQGKGDPVIYTVDLDKVEYMYQIRHAITQVMLIEGYLQSDIDELFNQQQDQKVKQA
jgi:hypothetical protein